MYHWWATVKSGTVAELVEYGPRVWEILGSNLWSNQTNVIGLTRPGFEPVGSRLEPVIFGFPDLPEWEAVTLLIQPPRLVYSALTGSIKLTQYSLKCSNKYLISAPV